ncbi:MAG: hypothetical protein LQ338_004081 [Usnochroma carphineum]|nr:MAG: hypothetical protein LQ338_004081 [Usnochroma carphineum]
MSKMKFSYYNRKQLRLRLKFVLMTKMLEDQKDWLSTTSKFHTTSPPSTEFLQPAQPLIALCNLSPYNPYFISDLQSLGPPPARELRKPPAQPLETGCNLTPANPYILPTMVWRIRSFHA